MNIITLRAALSAGLVAIVLLLGPPARASLLIDSTRYYNGGVPGTGTAADYVSVWNTLAGSSASAGYGNVVIGSWAGVRNAGGANTDVASLYRAIFTVAAAGRWTFRTSFDSGWGGTLMVDGVALQTRATDMWWNGVWTDPTQYLEGSLSLGVGSHELDVYGFEPCCDGVGQGQFSGPGAGGMFRTFSSADGLNTISEPTTIALIGAGFTGLGMLRRWRARR